MDLTLKEEHCWGCQLPREKPPHCLRVKSESESHSVVSDSATPGTVAHQAPLSMECSRQEDWRRVAMPSSRGSSCPSSQTPGLLYCRGILYLSSHNKGCLGKKKKKKRKMNFPAEQSFPRYLHNLWSLLKGQRLGFGTRRCCAMASWTNWCLSIECVLFEFSEIPAKGLNILCARGFECKWRGRGVSGVPKRLSKLSEIVKAIAEVGSSTS